MKLSLILMLVCTMQLSASVSLGQQVSVKSGEASLESILDDLNKQTGTIFMYNKENVDDCVSLELNMESANLENVLDEICKQASFKYEIIDEFVVITKIAPVVETVVQQEKKSVTGKVIDKDGISLPGVSVVIKGTTVGTSTNIEGKYTLDVPEQGKVLIFSFVGMTTQEVAVSSSVINVTMDSDSEQMEEVVVTALGIKRERKALGYAISSIKSEELVKGGTPVNALTSLYGKAAGVRVSSTAGGPTAGMILNIRNSVSFNENTNTRPLIVVDGIPIFDENTGSSRNDRDGRDRGTGINDINADDIESIEILKGAKSAVLYGSAGANGVVLITTKAGRKKEGLGVDVSTSYTWDNVSVYPEFQNEFGTGGNVAVDGIDPSLTDAGGYKYEMIDGVKTPVYFKGSASFGPKMDGREILWWDGEMRPYSPQSNNFKKLFNTGHLRSTNIALSNAGEIGSVRFSYTNKDYESVVIGATQKNHSVSFNAALNISPKVKLRFVSNYYRTENHNAPYRMQDAFVTYGVRRDVKADLWKNNITDEGGYSYFRTKDVSERVGGTSIHGEYLWGQTQNDYDEVRDHFIQSVNLDVELAKGLNLQVLSGVDYTRKNNTVKKKVSEPLALDYQQGLYSIAERNIMNFYTQGILSYQKKINDDFTFDGMFGAVYKYNQDKQVRTETRNFLVENWFSTSNSTNDVKSSGSGYNRDDSQYSLLGSAQVAYKDYLFVDFQARNDWSSILPKSDRSYFYPGTSVSWIASQHLDLPSVIKFAKVRGSWADVGIPGSRYYSNFAFNSGSYGSTPYATMPNDLPPVDLATAIKNGTFPLESLKPERKREFELGLEMNFFEASRLGFDLSLYKSTVYNQIMGLNVPPSSGVSKIRINAGEIQHKGVELQLRGTPVLIGDFRWNMTLNTAYDKTKIIELDKGVEILPLWGLNGAKVEARVGGEYGEIYIHPWKRDESGNKVVGSDGVYLFDKEVDKKVGVSVPDWTGGVNSNFTYKGFSLDFDLDYQFGGTIISQSNMYLKGNGTGKESLKYRDEARGGLPYYVDNSGVYHQVDGHDAAVPSDSKFDFVFHDGVVVEGVKEDGSKNDKIIAAQTYYQNTYWQGQMDVTEDGIYKSDYVALRKITCSYNVPKKIIQKLRIQNMKLSVFAMNVGYLYKDVPNVSPESYAGTNEFTEHSGMPGVRSIGCEIKLSF